MSMCGVCGHRADQHHRSYCRQCDCTTLLPPPTCQCKDGQWNWMCKLHGTND